MEELNRMVQIRVPRTLLEINGSDRVGVIAKELGAKRVLILTDVGVKKAGLIDRIEVSLQAEKITYEIYSGCLESAPLSVIRECCKLVERDRVDLIIAVGGGSVMDAAKLAAILPANGGDVSVLFEPNKIVNSGVPKIFLPTTSGTGSEWSNAAIFTDETNKRKVPIHNTQ